MTRSARSDADVTRLLSRWRDGDEAALEELLPAVYSELRKLAASQFRVERTGHTLQPTALVHEAYLRLVRQDPGRIDNRTHFYALAAKAMRQILVDHARGRAADKRPGSRERITLAEDLHTSSADDQTVDVLALHDALDDLAEFQPRAAKVVELRYFGGLTEPQTAEVLEVSRPTVTRDWAAAKLWLHDRLYGL